MKAVLSQGSGQVSSHLTKTPVVGEAEEAHDNTADRENNGHAGQKDRKAGSLGRGNGQIKI